MSVAVVDKGRPDLSAAVSCCASAKGVGR
jgi:hypothetical protein